MIAEIAKSVASPSRLDKKNAGKMSPAVTSHVISCLDLLSANYDGLAAAAAHYAAKFHLLHHLLVTLNAVSLDDRVRVS